MGRGVIPHVSHGLTLMDEPECCLFHAPAFSNHPSLAIGDAAASELSPVNVKILAGTEGSLTRSGEHHGGV